MDTAPARSAARPTTTRRRRRETAQPFDVRGIRGEGKEGGTRYAIGPECPLRPLPLVDVVVVVAAASHKMTSGLTVV